MMKRDDKMKPTAMLAEMKHNTALEKGRYRVRVGMATCGISAGADVVHDAFVSSVKDAGLDNVDIIPTGCVGRCDLEPMAEVTRGNEPPVLYILLDKDKVRKIVDEHLSKGQVVEDYTA
ncbi:MAG: (2Fe-2S) ferredoxin domain-containing protein [Armatimonadota bacterium]|nr:(2Fe-2S) ferredoxin domain-containing protein [bacterium]